MKYGCWILIKLFWGQVLYSVFLNCDQTVPESLGDSSFNNYSVNESCKTPLIFGLNNIFPKSFTVFNKKKAISKNDLETSKFIVIKSKLSHTHCRTKIVNNTIFRQSAIGRYVNKSGHRETNYLHFYQRIYMKTSNKSNERWVGIFPPIVTFRLYYYILL